MIAAAGCRFWRRFRGGQGLGRDRKEGRTGRIHGLRFVKNGLLHDYPVCSGLSKYNGGCEKVLKGLNPDPDH